MSELRPCPFCWSFGKDLVATDVGVAPSAWAVVCTECGAQGPSNHLNEDEVASEPNTTADQAITEWNMRA